MLPGYGARPITRGVVPTPRLPLTSQAALDTKMPLVLGGGWTGTEEAGPQGPRSWRRRSGQGPHCRRGDSLGGDT